MIHSTMPEKKRWLTMINTLTGVSYNTKKTILLPLVAYEIIKAISDLPTSLGRWRLLYIWLNRRVARWSECWLSERAKSAYSAGSRFPPLVPKEKVPFLAIWYILNWPSLFGLDGYILASFVFALAFSLASTSSRSIKDRKELGKIPSHHDLTLVQKRIYNERVLKK